MSDDQTTTASEEEEVTSPDEPGGAEAEALDTEDVGALKRALEREREERRTAKEELRRIREDEDAFLELAQKHNFQIADSEESTDDDEDEFDEDDAEPPADARSEERLAALEAEFASQRFNKDFGEAVGDRTVGKQGREWIELQTLRGGNNKQALEKAVNAWFEYEDDLRQQGLENVRRSKKAPHVPSGGKTATTVKDFSNMSRDEIDQWMIERARTLESQT